MHSGRKIFKSAAQVGFFIGVSRFLGFFREMAMACFFGTSLVKSAFDVAWRLPNLFRAILGEGALNAALVPVFTEVRTREGDKPAEKAASGIMALVGTLLLVIVLGGTLVLLVLGAFDLGPKWNEVTDLSVITLPYVLFICMAALCMGIFNSYGEFRIPAASLGLMNVVLLAAFGVLWMFPSVWTDPSEQIRVVAWSAIAAGAVQLGFQSVLLRRRGFNPEINMDWKGDKVRRFMCLMIPVVIGSGATQLNVYVSSIIAMAIGDWAPAALTYAERLIYLPLGLAATALSTVLLPAFSEQVASGRQQDMVRILNGSIRSICFVMMPLAAGVFALSLPCVSLVFEWKLGRFDAQSSLLTARALLAYAPGLVVFSINKVVVPAFYGMQDTKTPVRAAVAASIFNLVLNLLSIKYLPDGFQHAGLAASNVLSSVFSCTVLLVVLNRRIGGLGFKGTAWSMLSTAVSGVIMAAVTARVYDLADHRLTAFMAEGKVHQLVSLLAAGSAGMAVYVLVRFAVNRKETSYVLNSVFKTRNKHQA